MTGLSVNPGFAGDTGTIRRLTDVSVPEWYAEAVQFVAERNLMQGNGSPF